jgi:hypothetical protein
MQVTAFFKQYVIARGAPEAVLPVLRALPPLDAASDLLVFDDDSGRQVDLDLRPEASIPPRPRGRPALGVSAREVTLLPRHWDWLARQRGGASATLRALVEAQIAHARSPRECHDAAYWFLTVMAGNLPRFEDAVREIYAGNRVGFDHFSHGWPPAIRDHGRNLAFPA